MVNVIFELCRYVFIKHKAYFYKIHIQIIPPTKNNNSSVILQDAAVASLKSLNKNDVVEVKVMQRPPEGVKMVIEAVCIIKGVKAKKIPGEKVKPLFVSKLTT